MNGKVHIRRFISVFIIFTLLLSVFIPLPVFADGEQYAYVMGGEVRVRTEYTILGKLSYVKVQVLGSKTGTDGKLLYNIKYNDLQGYMHGDYIKVIDDENIGDMTFDEQLQKFPESYHASLIELHAIYPNWKFVAYDLPISFDDTLDKQDVFPKKLVPASYSLSLRSMGPDAYNWSNGQWTITEGSWVGASREIIAYHLDPRNFLNASDIYIFAHLGYDPTTQTRAGLELIIQNSFMKDGYVDEKDSFADPENGYKCSYVDVIMAAAEQNNVSPYMLASTIIQEQSATSPLISGNYDGGNGAYVGYYNYFNVNATGTSNEQIYINGLSYAKNKGWDTRSKSIIGGASFFATNYIKNGQYTYYYKNFDVKTGNCARQYAQNIYDSLSSSISLRNRFYNETSATLVFEIPVFKNMWETAPTKPIADGKKNNYYFTSLGVSGFSMYNENYSLAVSEDTNITYTVPSGASYSGQTEYNLTAGQNVIKLPVTAETGAVNIYTLNITATKACKLTLGGPPTGDDGGNEGDNEGGGTEPTPPPQPVINYGDVNDDGFINGVDAAMIKLHTLKLQLLNAEEAIRANVNGDEFINGKDAAMIKLHVLKLQPITR